MRITLETVFALVFVVSALGCWYGIAARIEGARKHYEWEPDDRAMLRGFFVSLVLSAAGLVLMLFPPR